MSQYDAHGPGTGPLPAAAPPPYGPPGYEQGYGEHDAQQGWQPGGQQVYDQYGYPAAGSPPPGYGYGYDLGPQRTNVMAILGLVFAFVFSPLGIVFSAIGLGQVRRRGEKGRGLALTGLILSVVFLVIGVLFTIVVVAAAGKAVDTAAQELRASASAAGASGTAASGSDAASGTSPGAGSVAGGGDTGVATACQTIIPALINLEAQMQDVHTPDQYSQALATLESTLSTAAGGATDTGFQQDIAALNADMEKASAAVQKGDDPSSLMSALDADGAAVGEACAVAGVTD